MPLRQANPRSSRLDLTSFFSAFVARYVLGGPIGFSDARPPLALTMSSAVGWQRRAHSHAYPVLPRAYSLTHSRAVR